MIIKLIPARDATSLFEYLAGEGKHNEHSHQRVIYNNQASPADAAVPITKKDAKNLATDFETYIKKYGSTRTFKSNRKGAKNNSRDQLNLYHGVISLDPDETPPSDETWAKIVDRYSTLMGWQEPDGNYAPNGFRLPTILSYWRPWRRPTTTNPPCGKSRSGDMDSETAEREIVNTTGWRLVSSIRPPSASMRSFASASPMPLEP